MLPFLRRLAVRLPFLRKEGQRGCVAKSGGAGVDASRRRFLAFSAAGMATAALPELPQGEGAAGNSAPAAVPPGAQSVGHLLSHCTACGLCIAACPSQVLRPSVLSLGLRGFMMPVLDFSRASCKPDCNTCSQLCPAGALLPLTPEEKRRTQIGLAHFRQEHCRVWAQGEACAECVQPARCSTGALVAQELSVPFVQDAQCRGCRRCARVCPAGAIRMAEVEGRSKRLAVIDRSKCIGCGACASACRPQAIELRSLTAPRLAVPEACTGCGACEHACPATPQKAMQVEPFARHTLREEKR